MINFKYDYVNFLDKVFINLSRVKIDVSQFKIDHIACRTETDNDYREVSAYMRSFGKRVTQVIFKNRPVDMYELDQPLEYHQYKIKYFEVMAPAEGDKYNNGLEHAEFVINISLTEFVSRYPNVTWNVNSINRPIGADVGVRFEDAANAKFKTMTMEEIIEAEK
ncbi:MAG: VOC family protein [Microgenomates group bacterium]